MNLHHFPWKPVAKEAAVVVAREAGVYLFRLAIDHAIDWLHADETGPESREQPGSGRRPSGRPQTEEEADPEKPGPGKQGAQRRKRDENGRYARKTKGGDNP